MPKNEIDYSNTIIYKIFCKNKNINEVYIGHTTNLIKRKYQHKIESKNILNKKLNISTKFLYNFRKIFHTKIFMKEKKYF